MSCLQEYEGSDTMIYYLKDPLQDYIEDDKLTNYDSSNTEKPLNNIVAYFICH